MHARILKLTALLAMGALVLPFGFVTAQTPQATPVEDQVARFVEERDRLVQMGQEAVELFLNGDDEALLELMTPDLAAAFGGSSPSKELEKLTTNRVRMDFPEVGGVFDGHFDGSNEIAGFFYQGSPLAFTLTAETEQTGDVPTGAWTGAIDPDGINLGIELTFTGSRQDLAATLDIPSQGLTGVPLSNVAFVASAPLGDLVVDGALPWNETVHVYQAQYDWSGRLLDIQVSFDAEGRLSGFQAFGNAPLPPDPAAGVDSTVAYSLPSAGQWLVLWGGETTLQNYHASSPQQRHAYDLLMWRDGSTYSGDGTRNEDYYAWGQPMLSPAAGTVVEVVKTLPDVAPQSGITDQSNPAGNHIVLQTGEHEFVYLAHMQQGSVTVKVGDTLQAGDPVGLVGNSGNTSEPHIHIHVQNTLELFDPEAFGLPLAFEELLVNDVPQRNVAPVQGQMIAPVPHP